MPLAGTGRSSSRGTGGHTAALDVADQARTYQLPATGEWVDVRNCSGPEGYASSNVFLWLAEWAEK
jgi:hypothetical protein